jgi:colanic acid biosynthesis glycosyl transferase WcaI
MRLLVVTQYFWPENFRINDLVKEFTCKGHEVTVLTGWPNYPDGAIFEAFRQDPQQYAAFSGARVVRVPLFTRGGGGLRLIFNYLSFALSASLLGWWKLRGQEFDVVLVYEPSPITVGIPGVVMRAIKRAPMAFWVLDLWPETLKAVGVVKSELLLGWIGKLVTFIYRRCDLIVAQSKSFIPQIRRYAGEDRRIEYFPNWAESVFDADGVVPATEVSSGTGAFTVMFAGNIGDAQDFPAILAAAESLNDRIDIRWLIVGDGRMAGWVAQEIEARNLGRSVQLLGRHPLERMPAFFRHADALLMSLKDEPIFAMTIPGKLQSYLASGIPVIAMLNGEGAALLSDAGAGLACAAGDHAGLAQAVLTMAGMAKSEREAMGERGRELYVREFQREHLLERCEGWLVDLADAKQKARSLP